MDTCHDLVRLLEYPTEGYGKLVERAAQVARHAVPETATCLATFCKAIQGLGTEQLQELFIQTFDLNPVCALEVGWQLFGDEYRRGEFLVKMRGELRRYDLTESGELPDHLTHVLPVLARMDSEEAAQFASRFVLPAVEKMLAALNGRKNPFENVLLAVRAWLRGRCVMAAREVSHA